MINVKDRIPTKPHRRKITHQEGYLPVYEIDENGHLIVNVPKVEYATVERADEPTEDGTPINKALFDSIDTDLQAKVVLSDKASTADAQTGTDDTKWMTPLKVSQSKIGSKLHIATGTVAHNGTIPKTSGYENYFYIVTPQISAVEGQDSNNSSISGYYFTVTCTVNQSTRKVTCQASMSTIRAVSSQVTSTKTKNLNATYYEIAWN